MQMPLRKLALGLLIAGAMPIIGCTQQPPSSDNTPTKPKVVASTPAPSATVAVSPSASATTAQAPPSAAPSSPVAVSSSGSAPAGPVEYKRVEYDAAGVEFDVPKTFEQFKPLGDWLAAADANSDIAIFVRSKEWKEWDDILKIASDTFTDFKASDAELTKDKTSDGIPVWYDYGAAKKKDGKVVFVALAGYDLSDHDFVMAVLGDPDDKRVKDIAIHAFTSVTRQSKYNNQGGGDGKSEGGDESK